MNTYKVEGHIIQDGSNLAFTRIVEAESRDEAIAKAKSKVQEKYTWLRDDRVLRGPAKVTEIEQNHQAMDMQTKGDQVMITSTTFNKLSELASEGKEGLVLLGCGGNLEEWSNNALGILKQAGIAKDSFAFADNLHVTTTGGRNDLLLLFPEDGNGIDIGALAIWRFSFSDCSWLSDYVKNYRNQHGFSPLPEPVIE